MFKDIKAHHFIGMMLVIAGMIGLGFRVDYSGWVLFCGLLNLLWDL